MGLILGIKERGGEVLPWNNLRSERSNKTFQNVLKEL
jgi:hypothetical protein